MPCHNYNVTLENRLIFKLARLFQNPHFVLQLHTMNYFCIFYNEYCNAPFPEFVPMINVG